MPKLCECAGAEYRGGETIRHVSFVANQNKGVDMSGGLENSGLLRSIVKYGNISNRKVGYQPQQLEAARNILDPRLMNLLSYAFE